MEFLITVVVNVVLWVTLFLLIDWAARGRRSVVSTYADNVVEDNERKKATAPNKTIADLRDVEVAYLRYADLDNLTQSTQVSPHRRGRFQIQMTNAGGQYALVWRNGKRESIEIK